MNMKCVFTGLLLVISMVSLTGCATPKKEIVQGQSVYVNTVPEEKGQKTVTLECLSAHQLGCRHKGRIYPWNAWVEKMGYKAQKYTVVDVQQNGNKAVVTLIER